MSNDTIKQWHIRRATPSDAERICEMLFMLKTMYASTLANNLQEFLLLHLPVIQQAIDMGQNLVLVACKVDGELVGFISLTIRTVLRVPSPVGSIEEIFVCPEYRKCGVGTALWKEAALELRGRAVSRVEVITSLAHPGQRQFAKSIGMEWYSSVHILTI